MNNETTSITECIVHCTALPCVDAFLPCDLLSCDKITLSLVSFRNVEMENTLKRNKRQSISHTGSSYLSTILPLTI